MGLRTFINDCLGAVGDAVATTDTGSFSLNSLTQRLNQTLGATSATGSLSSLNALITLDTTQKQTVSGFLNTSGFTGTIDLQTSLDGINFTSVSAISYTSSTATNTVLNAGHALQGALTAQLKVTAYTSGTCTGFIKAERAGSWLKTVVGHQSDIIASAVNTSNTWSSIFKGWQNLWGFPGSTAATSVGTNSWTAIFKAWQSTFGFSNDTVATSDTGTFSLVALFKRLLAKISSAQNTDGSVNIEFAPGHLSAFGDFTSVPKEQALNIDFLKGLPDGSYVATSGTGASVTVANNQLVVQSGTSSTGYAIYATDVVRYRAKLGVEAGFTPVFDTPVANCFQFQGMANCAINALQTIIDGYLLCYYVGTDSTSTAYTGTTIGILHRNSASGSVVDRFYPQSQWTDRLDGSGASGITWDFTKGLPFDIDYPYQGYGNISLKIAHPTKIGKIEFLVIKYANTASVPQLANANMRYVCGVINSGNTTNKTLKCGSIAAFVLGFKKYDDKTYPIKSSKAVTNGNALPLLGVQIPVTMNGVALRGYARLASAVGYSGGNSYGEIDYILNPTTITGSAWALDDNSTGSTIPTGGTITLGGSDGARTITVTGTTAYATNPFIVDTSATAVSGGRLRGSIGIGTNTSQDHDYLAAERKEPLKLKPGDIIYFVAQPLANGRMGIILDWINEL